MGKDIALGLTHHGSIPSPSFYWPNPREAIEVFGRQRKAWNYRYWVREGLTPTRNVAFDFELAFQEATANAKVIHFNLDGLHLRNAWSLGQNADPYVAGMTNWEFANVLQNGELRQKTVFWQNNRRVSLSRVLERAGVTPHGIP